MPEVPLLYPTVEQSGGGASPVRIDTPIQAFGGGVGAALEHLGVTAEHSADEIWQRAIQMKDLQNRTEADNLDSQFALESGKLHAEFSALKGVNAGPKAFEDYSSRLDQLRQRLRGTATNPMVQRLYDTQSRRTFAGTVANMAGHAGSETKAAALDGAKANADMHYNRAATADGERMMLSEMAQGDAATRNYHSIAGTPDSIEDSISSAHSSVLSHFSVGLSRNGNDAGAKDFNDRWRSSMIKPGDLERAEQSRLTHGIAINSENTADQILDKAESDNEMTKTKEQVAEIARKRAQGDFPGNGVAERAYVSAAERRWNERKQAQTQLVKESEDTLYGLLLDPNVGNMQKVLAHPDGAPAYNNLPNRLKNKITGLFDRKEDRTNWNTLVGMYLGSKDNPDVRERFENLSLSELQSGGKYAVTPEHATQFVRWRKGLDPKDSIRVHQVYNTMLNSSLRGAMQTLMVADPRTNPDEYNKFIGELSGILEARGLDAKPPSLKEVQDEIGPQLIQMHATPSWFSREPTTTPRLNEPPEDFVRSMQNDRSRRGMPPYSDGELQRAYGIKIWKEHYSAQQTP
jgi:hypothetical protein